jgi:hypothetical protein
MPSDPARIACHLLQDGSPAHRLVRTVSQEAHRVCSS